MSTSIRYLFRATLPIVALAAALLGSPSRAQAVQVRTNPFGDRPTTIVIGAIGNDTWLLFTASEQECRWEHIGDIKHGLVDDFQVDGGNGSDTMIEMGLIPDAELFICGFSMTDPFPGGKRVSFNGRGGNDYIETGFDPADLFGGDGNDWLQTGRFDAFVSGGPGNDTLISNSTQGMENFFGGPGRDCIFDESGSAATVNCGGQSRDRSNIPDPSCPLLVTDCS